MYNFGCRGTNSSRWNVSSQSPSMADWKQNRFVKKFILCILLFVNIKYKEIEFYLLFIFNCHNNKLTSKMYENRKKRKMSLNVNVKTCRKCIRHNSVETMLHCHGHSNFNKLDKRTKREEKLIWSLQIQSNPVNCIIVNSRP